MLNELHEKNKQYTIMGDFPPAISGKRVQLEVRVK